MTNEHQHHAIATQAYSFWEQEGYPQGRSLDHWLAAERQIMLVAKEAADAEPKPAAAKPKARRAASAKKQA